MWRQAEAEAGCVDTWTIRGGETKRNGRERKKGREGERQGGRKGGREKGREEMASLKMKIVHKKS